MLSRFRQPTSRNLQESGELFRFSRIQKIAVAILLIAGLALGGQVFQLAIQPETTLRSIADSDDATGNAFFTQRETLVLAVYLERWMSGNENKRSVLVRRALLGQRLNVRDSEGIANGERASLAYLESLEKIDGCLASASDGVLTSVNQNSVRQACGDEIEVLIFEARQLGVDISGAGDVRVRDIIQGDREARGAQTLRLLVLVVLMLVVGGFLGLSRTKTFRRLRQVLEEDQIQLGVSQGELRNMEVELDKRIESESRQRSEDQRLDAAVRVLTTSIRKATSESAIAEILVNSLREFLNSDLIYIHLFANPEQPDFVHVVPGNEASRSRVAELGIGPDSSAGMSAVAQSVWQQAEIRPIPLLELRTYMPTTLIDKLEQLGITGNSDLVPIGEGQQVLGYLIIRRSLVREWQANEVAALQNSVSQAANAIGALRSTALVRQVRENQQVVSELRQLDRLKDEFTANVNHELRTPLTSIIGYLEVISSDSAELSPTTKKYLSTVRRNADRLLELIERLLVVSRSATEGEAQKADDVDFAEIVVESVRTVREKHPANSVNVTTDIAPGSFVMSGDRLRLEQIVLNVVGNAVKFSGNSQVVSVKLRHALDEFGKPFAAELVVEDSGIGIPANEIPHLFSRFFRASNAEKALVPGTGLGLSIVKKFVEDHNGSIAVDSVIGEGTTVTVRLPLSHQIPH